MKRLTINFDKKLPFVSKFVSKYDFRETVYTIY